MQQTSRTMIAATLMLGATMMAGPASGLATPAVSELTAPLPVRNLYPPMMRFFDPTPDSAMRAYEPFWTLELNQHYSTVNTMNVTATSNLLVDMELYVLDPVLRRAVTPRLELSLRSPILMPSSGLFDSAIQRFHGWFNMPNGGRELRPKNRYAYQFNAAQGGGWQSRNRATLGNIELSGRYQIQTGETWAIAALAAVKLPTASQSDGWGSGAADIGGGLLASWANQDWFAHIEAWFIQPLAKDEPGIHYRSYPRGSLTTGFRFTPETSFILQAQGGNSPYRSYIGELDHPPFLISFGLRSSMASDVSWNLAVVENITQKTTQDISISFGFSHLH